MSKMSPLEALDNLWYGQKTTENYQIIYKELKSSKNVEKQYHKITKRIEDICFKHKFCGLNELEEKLEKSLKALEIIKEKRVDVFGLICCIELNKYTSLETYNTKENCHNYPLTKEEYDLLKEVLDNE